MTLQRAFDVDSKLNERQLHRRVTLQTLSAQRIEPVTVRFDALLIEGQAQPHADLYFYVPSRGRLIPALALPLDTLRNRLVWPEVFAAWPAQFLAEISSRVLALWRQQPRLGQVIPIGDFDRVFGGSVQQMLDGRSIPGLENYWTSAQVLNRYQWVQERVHSGRILEVATGPGYGAAWLLERRPGVSDYFGVDLDALAIGLARRLNPGARARFHLGPIEALEESGFDWVFSLETIEHTPDPEAFLMELKRRLAPGGRMLVSLPCERWHGFHLNPHHWSAWNYRRIRDFLQPHFERVHYWRQGRPRFTENALEETGRITPLSQIDPDWDEDYLMLLEGPRPAPPRPRIVVQRRYARGDVLQATPIVRAVRQRFPDHTIVVSTDIDEVFAGNPNVDLLMATSSGFRPRPDDQVINLDVAYERRPKQHILSAYAEEAGVTLPNPALELHLDRRDYAQVNQWMAGAGPSWGTVKRIVAVHMGATPDRSWPPSHWAEFLSAFSSDTEVGIIAVGAGADFQPPAAERILNLVNRLDLRETAAAIATADLLVGPDSALLHIAAAVGTPAVGLYGMADPRLRVPFGADQTALRSPVDCAGCLHDLPAPNTNPRCKFGRSFCMEEIAPAVVVEAARARLARCEPHAWRVRLHLGGGQDVHLKEAVTSAIGGQTDTQPSPLPTLPWLPEARCLPTERSWAEETIERWRQEPAGLPRFTIAVLPHPENAFGADASAASLADQWLPGESRVLEPRGDAAALIADANAQLIGSGADWVGVIDAGDRLAPDAFFRIAHALRQHPGWQIVYTDEDQLSAEGQHLHPHCKPDFNLDYLRSLPYVGGLLLIRRDLFQTLGGFDPQADGAEDYDWTLRAWEHLQASGAGEAAIGHVPEVLYHRLQGSGHTRRSIPEILDAGQAALQRHLDRVAPGAKAEPGPFPPSFRVRWPLPEVPPLVSVLIPTRDQLPLLQRCIESVIEKTRYPAYEILIIDNGSETPEARSYLAAIEAKEAELGGRLRVVRQPGPFNFSAMNNAAARLARGEYLLLLNNDTAALHEDWLDEMMGHAVRTDVGIVGAKLLFPDGRIQHAGVILGMRGPAEHPFIGHAPEDRGYFGRAQLTQDLSAVTGACLLIRRSLYEAVGGLDETAFKVSYNDIDLCLKVRTAGYRVVFTAFALLLHEGSATQKAQNPAPQTNPPQKEALTPPDPAKLQRFEAEKEAMYRRWLPLLGRDPAYNRHLTLASTEFQLEDQPCVSWDPDWRPRPRILAHAADREGCGEYRIIAPLRALNRAGMTQGWESMRLFEPAEMARIEPDTLVVQRQLEWHQIEFLEKHRRHSRAFRVFEIDDLITNLPQKSVHRQNMHKDMPKRLRRAVGLCDRLVVATEPLARAYAGLCDEVRVQPNYLERARWGALQPPRREHPKPRVGWAGGVGHLGDLELLRDVVRETANEFDWVFFGMCPEPLRPYVREFHPGVPLDQYPAKLAALDLDIAVAPLEINPFNEAKSHLRLLEYGILGYAVVCTDIVPYQGDFPVVRVPNRFKEWTKALRELANDRSALRAAGDALKQQVRARWMLEDHLGSWLSAWTRSDV